MSIDRGEACKTEKILSKLLLVDLHVCCTEIAFLVKLNCMVPCPLVVLLRNILAQL